MRIIYFIKSYNLYRMNIIISLAGRSSRFFNNGFTKPKFYLPLHDNTTMIEGSVNTLNMEGQYIFIVQEEHCEKYKIDTFLKQKYPSCIIRYLDTYTSGCVESVYLACKDIINTSNELIISNCDQYLEWDSTLFLKKCRESGTDGCVLTYFADTIKNSYVKLDNDGYAELFREKVVISNNSLVGVHYWKRGCDFVSSAEYMIENNVRDNGEYYVSISYNYLINKGMKISICSMGENDIYHSIGVPETYYDFLQKKIPIEIKNIKDMKRGWFLGNFEPSIQKSEDVEIGILEHKKDEIWPAHVHRIADEINVLISGKMIINNIEINKDTIFKIPKGLLTKAIFLEDCKIVCIKLPSNTSDKYCY